MADTPAQKLYNLALDKLGFEPTEKQAKALRGIAWLATSHEPNDVLVINGFAGTGKTSAIGAAVAAMRDAGYKTVVLAPTGRAAKVAQSFAGGIAKTIHKHIYRINPAEPGRWFNAENRLKDTIFFIDEASMITDDLTPGNSSLLSDLVNHVYSAPGCAMVLIGDEAQLPPVGQSQSTAMNPDRLRQLGLNPYVVNMDEPVRQALKSGILVNAGIIRKMLSAPPDAPLPMLRANGFPDVKAITSAELADELSDAWGRDGAEESLIITRSNKRANNFNLAIRNRVLYAEEPLQQGERLIITRNNYFWTRNDKEIPFLANGETVRVGWAGRPEKKYGRWFVDVELYLPGNDTPIGAKIMMRSLAAEGPAVPMTEIQSLTEMVIAQTEGEYSEKLKAIDNDPWLNALQVKYAYCVTCHKAQGGQWKNVFIDMGGIAPDAMNADFYRWLYTAVTRTTKCLYLINPTIPVDSLID